MRRRVVKTPQGEKSQSEKWLRLIKSTETLTTKGLASEHNYQLFKAKMEK